MAAIIKRDINKIGTEQSEFPSVCERCLGPKTYMRMLKQPGGEECKICARPFTVYRWRVPGQSKNQKTVVCNGCCRARNCCAICMLDLQFGLPTQVRDAALKLADEKKTAVNRQFQAQQASAGDGSALEKYGGKSESAARDLLRRLANSKPYDRTGIESHSDKKSETARSRKQSLQTADGSIEPPPDKSITSLLLLGVSDELPEHAIRSFFSTHGQLRSVVCSHRSKCAFVNFTDRNYAERAAGACPEGKLTLRGVPLRVQWAKPRLLSGFHNEKRNAAIIDAGR